MLVVERIGVEGFGSYKAAAEIELNGQGALAIVGDNGSGKSTLVSKALAWGLYGKAAPERMGSSTSALKGKMILNDHADLATVHIVLRRGNASAPLRKWEIVRMRGRKGGDAITVNGNVASQGDIDAIIGANYEVFVRTCLRGQGDPWNWLEATDGRKREILDVICGSSALEARYEKARKLQKDLETVLDRVRSQIGSVERRVEETNPEPLAVLAATWDHDKEIRYQSALKEVEALYEALEAALRADQAMLTMHDPTPPVDPDDLLRQHKAAVDAASANRDQTLGDLNAARRLFGQVAYLGAGQACPTCGESIPPKSSIILERSLREKALQDAEAAHEAADAYHKECLRNRDEVRKWAADLRDREMVRRSYRPQEPSAKMAYDAAVRRAEDLHQAVNPYKVAAEQAEMAHESAAKELTLLQELVVTNERDLRMARAWVEVLSPKGVRAQLAEQAIYAIQDEANRWLKILSGGAMVLTLSPRTETREHITSTIEVHGKVRPLISLSGGEKRRVNLAVDMGIASVFTNGGGLALSLLVLDEEVLSGLDSEGKHQVTKALHNAGIADIVVVDHDPALYGSLPRTVKVVKDSNGSRVAEVV